MLVSLSVFAVSQATSTMASAHGGRQPSAADRQRIQAHVVVGEHSWLLESYRFAAGERKRRSMSGWSVEHRADVGPKPSKSRSPELICLLTVGCELNG
jgi:hypothetical protein